MGNFPSLKIMALTFFFVCLVAITAVTASGRFIKLDGQGNELADDAKEWAMVFDSQNDLYWEVKSADDSIHSNNATFTYEMVKDNFVAKVNESNFGGYSDWRLPTTQELASLKVRKKDSSEALVDLAYFPAAMPARYMSMGWCGSRSEYQEESVKFGNEKCEGGKYVRLVRGKPLE